jgi:hypothetical protein
VRYEDAVLKYRPYDPVNNRRGWDWTFIIGRRNNINWHYFALNLRDFAVNPESTMAEYVSRKLAYPQGDGLSGNLIKKRRRK